jgi:hypothetical protein
MGGDGCGISIGTAKASKEGRFRGPLKLDKKPELYWSKFWQLP